MSDSVFEWFIGAWFVVVTLSILDSLGDLAFWPWLYTLGLRVVAQEEPMLHAPLAAPGTVFETANGKFKVIDPSLVLMRQRYGLMRSRIQVRGTITWSGPSAQFEARVSWLTLAAPLVMLLIIVAAGVAENPAVFAPFALFLLGMVGLSAYTSRRQAHVLMREFRELSATPEAGRLTSASS